MYSIRDFLAAVAEHDLPVPQQAITKLRVAITAKH
jgi:hypothetical protein